ncbi:hypothetical protein M9Y10_014014 [Tritrichomonas musculus]|uniref:Surface antigen BspA-like n=1 Tax=Tritrichomonas musculus TaxID=1915356 RepID=A0ABR2KZA0_9EUKA
MNIVLKDGICFELNDRNCTAKVSESPNARGDIFIPSSINYKTQDFVVISIKEKSFMNNNQIKSINFQFDSRLQTIEKNAFAFSSLESLSIPSKVKELNYGWCRGTSKLIHISISPNNHFFSYLNNSLIIGKSKLNETDFYDSIYFVRRDINQVIIPSFIKYIKPFSFHQCNSLHKILFPTDSPIESIEKFAFNYSSIEYVSIPPNVKKIGGYSFCYCEKLAKVDFTINSELTSLGKYSFSNSSIKSISIPNKIKRIGQYSFYHCEKLKNVYFSKGSEFLSKIERGLFSFSSIEYIKIPSSVVEIGEFSFYSCHNLRTIEFNKNSNLNSIGKEAFSNSSIEFISIPIHVKKIPECCFRNCKKLKTIIFSINSELLSIEEEAFSNSSIEKVFIPSHVKKMGKNCFSYCDRLKTVEFSNDSELEYISERAFYRSSIQMISIPKYVMKIEDFAFSFCDCLKVVEFYPNVDISVFSRNAFTYSFLDKIIGRSIKTNNLKMIGNNAVVEIYNDESNYEEFFENPDDLYHDYNKCNIVLSETCDFQCISNCANLLLINESRSIHKEQKLFFLKSSYKDKDQLNMRYKNDF